MQNANLHIQDKPFYSYYYHSYLLLLLLLLYHVYVFVALQRASRKIGSPIESPSLNKDLTYLLNYLDISKNLQE